MKKLTLFATLCALLLGACTTNELDNITPEENISISLPDLTAAFADDDVTKTYVENSKYLRWHEDDRITAFFGNTLNRQYKFKGKTGANSGTFSLVPSGELGTGNDLEAIYAVYPYDESAEISDEGVISLSLPAVQGFAEESFGRGANTMIAVTAGLEDTFLGFKNACGYLKLKLYNEEGKALRSVEVKGNNGEKIAGSATATMEFGGVPTLTMGADTTTSVTLDCGEEGIELGTTAESATELWIVLPATTFEGGITITATDIEGGTFEKSTTKPVAITRNDIQPMAALEAEFTPLGPANNEIWYTATEQITPYATDAFGATYLPGQSTYNSETQKGILVFDGEITKIGDKAFYNCETLSSIDIPNSVTEVGDRAFYYCKTLKSIVIPNSVSEIKGNAFAFCDNLAEVVLPSTITSIGEAAFDSCTSLQNFSLPEDVTSIGSYAFRECTSLTNFTIPDSVTSIGSYAFYGCSSLTSVTFGKGELEIGREAFRDCNLQEVHITDVGAWCQISYENQWAAPLNYTHNLYLNGELVTDVVIPEGITKIGDYSFYKCESLTSVTFPSSVTSIGKYAFFICPSLQSVTLQEGAEEVALVSDTNIIGEYAFSYCTKLEKVTIPNSVSRIERDAFWDCTSLTSITIPKLVSEIGENAFFACDNLKSTYVKDLRAWCAIKFEDGDSNPLSNKSDLYVYGNKASNLDIPYDVTEIGQYAFYNCPTITSVTIPAGVTSIGMMAFYWCNNLASIYSKPTTPPTLGSCSLGDDYSPYTSPLQGIYVPDDSVDAYKTQWSDYAEIIYGKIAAEEEKKHTPVDLGLSVMWSSCNLYGSEYDKDKCYNWYDDFDRVGVEWTAEDPATKILGDKWRVPTRSEWEELLANCKVYISTASYASHLVVESKINGNKIYLPAGEPGDSDWYGRSYYWSSTSYDSTSAHALYFYEDAEDGNESIFMTTRYKTNKLLIRPVYIQ